MALDKNFNAAEAEARLYAAWEKAGAFATLNGGQIMRLDDIPDDAVMAPVVLDGDNSNANFDDRLRATDDPAQRRERRMHQQGASRRGTEGAELTGEGRPGHRAVRTGAGTVDRFSFGGHGAAT